MLACLKFPFKSFLPFLCKGDTSAIFKEDDNKNVLEGLLIFVHKKLANMPKISLIILMGMSESWEASFLSNLSMPYFVSSMLISEKQNVSFLHLLCIANMLG